MSNALRVQKKEEIMGPTIWEYTTMEITALVVGIQLLTIVVTVLTMFGVQQMVRKYHGGRNKDNMKRWKVEAYRRAYAGSTTTRLLK